MAKWGKCDFKQLERLNKNMEKLMGADLDRFCRQAAQELAGRLLNKVVKRTPVVYGTLRDAWAVMPVGHRGTHYTVVVLNNLQYASYVEYGHRQQPGRFIPGYWESDRFVYDPDAEGGMVLKKNWVKGRYMTTVATGAQTTATFAQTAAQYGLNAALMACPLTWIIILIIALVALFYAAVAAVNHFAGTSVSATGLMCGAFMAALAFIGNIFVALWNLVVDVFVMIYNLVATVANFIGNVFNDPVGAVARLFFDLADTVLSVLQALASAIDTIFGSNLAGSVQGWRDSLGGWVDSTFGKGEEIMEKLNAEDLHLGRFEYGAAFDMGYEFGQGVEDTVGGLFDFSAMNSLGAADGLDAFNLGNTLDGIYGNTGDTAGNTAAMSDALDIAEEDLAYMRDIAEREAINRFTTAEIKVEQHNENHISKDTDLDGIMDAWANDFAEKLDVSEEGVHE